MTPMEEDLGIPDEENDNEVPRSYSFALECVAKEDCFQGENKDKRSHWIKCKKCKSFADPLNTVHMMAYHLWVADCHKLSREDAWRLAQFTDIEHGEETFKDRQEAREWMKQEKAKKEKKRRRRMKKNRRRRKEERRRRMKKNRRRRSRRTARPTAQLAPPLHGAGRRAREQCRSLHPILRDAITMTRLVQGARAPGLAPRMVVDLALAVQVAVDLALAEILALALHLEKVESWCQGIPPMEAKLRQTS